MPAVTIKTFTLTARLVGDDLAGGRLQYLYEVSDGLGCIGLGPFDRAVEEFARQLRKFLPNDPLVVPEVKL